MKFTSPVLLWGVFAAAVPIIIHLIGRRRAPRRPFAALHFLLRSNRHVAQRLRLRQFIVLILRALLAGILAIMVAKPFYERETELPALSGRPQSAVIIVDDSLSMRQMAGRARAFDLAKEKVHELLNLLGPQAEVAVLLLTQPTGPLPALTREQRQLHAVVDGLSPSFRHAVLGPVLSQAVAILRHSGQSERRIFFISDVAAHNFVPAPVPPPPEIALHLINVLGPEPLGNRVVVDLHVEAENIQAQRAIKIGAWLCNYAPQENEAKLSLYLEEERVSTTKVALKANNCQRHLFVHQISGGGARKLRVKFDRPDQLPEDDERVLLVTAEQPLRVLLVNGRPSPVRHRDEVFYLRTALQTLNKSGEQLLETTSVTSDDLAAAKFANFDLVVLANVASLPEAAVANLKDFVFHGGGLFISLGNNTDAATFNRQLNPLLPQLLGSPRAGTSDGDNASLRIGRVNSDHPLNSALWSDAASATTALRFIKFWRVYQLLPASTAGRQILWWFESGAPALVERQIGAGRVLLFPSTIDREWNDWPIRPQFLPLLQQIVRYLSHTPSAEAGKKVVVGETISVPLPAGIKELQLIGATGLEQRWISGDLQGKSAIDQRFDRPGYYRFAAFTADGLKKAMPHEALAVNIDALESDLRFADLSSNSKLKMSAPGPAAADSMVRTSNLSTAKARRPVEMWSMLGGLLLLLLCVESFLIRRG